MPDCKICRRDYEDHSEPCELCGRPPEHHGPGDPELERAGRRRMAAARQAAGQPLDKVDEKTLITEPEEADPWATPT